VSHLIFSSIRDAFSVVVVSFSPSSSALIVVLIFGVSLLVSTWVSDSSTEAFFFLWLDVLLSFCM